MNPAILMLVIRVLLALLLYAFLAALLVFLWRDLQGRGKAEEAVPAAHLLVEEGPEPGKAFPMAGIVMLGRSAENDVSLPDDTVSAQHARISFLNGQWWLEDLGSRNGTTLNSAPVGRAAAISSGDMIGVGRVRLIFKAGASEKQE